MQHYSHIKKYLTPNKVLIDKIWGVSKWYGTIAHPDLDLTSYTIDNRVLRLRIGTSTIYFDVWLDTNGRITLNSKIGDVGTGVPRTSNPTTIGTAGSFYGNNHHYIAGYYNQLNGDEYVGTSANGVCKLLDGPSNTLEACPDLGIASGRFSAGGEFQRTAIPEFDQDKSVSITAMTTSPITDHIGVIVSNRDGTAVSGNRLILYHDQRPIFNLSGLDSNQYSLGVIPGFTKFGRHNVGNVVVNQTNLQTFSVDESGTYTKYDTYCYGQLQDTSYKLSDWSRTENQAFRIGSQHSNATRLNAYVHFIAIHNRSITSTEALEIKNYVVANYPLTDRTKAAPTTEADSAYGTVKINPSGTSPMTVNSNIGNGEVTMNFQVNGRTDETQIITEAGSSRLTINKLKDQYGVLPDLTHGDTPKIADVSGQPLVEWLKLNRNQRMYNTTSLSGIDLSQDYIIVTTILAIDDTLTSRTSMTIYNSATSTHFIGLGITKSESSNYERIYVKASATSETTSDYYVSQSWQKRPVTITITKIGGVVTCYSNEAPIAASSQSWTFSKTDGISVGGSPIQQGQNHGLRALSIIQGADLSSFNLGNIMSQHIANYQS